jgi:GntR family transcriptional regulator/MocR family aminotransferase
MLPEINPSLIFTTPSHQFPTGAVLPMNRRISLIEYAKKTGAYIVEDDYDSEFRYEGYPIQSMQSLSADNIIYIGTFSKTLCPALRIGYMILPEKLAPKIQAIKYIDDLHSPILEQLTLSRFINKGLLDRHIAISKKHYAQKCSFIMDKLVEKFGEHLEIYGHTAGIHIMVRFNGINFTDTFVEDARKKGINVDLASSHSISNAQYNDCLLFGFGNLDDSTISKGIEIFSHLLI